MMMLLLFTDPSSVSFPYGATIRPFVVPVQVDHAILLIVCALSGTLDT